MRFETSLKKHRVKHEKPDWLRCPFCYEGFFRQDMLGSHIVSSHLPTVEVIIDFGMFPFYARVVKYERGT
jgi:hypothetical protein